MLDIYVISISNGNDQLDCMKCSYFKQKAIRDNAGLIVGLAKGYSEAQNLMISMIEESLRETGSANVKEYLINNPEIAEKVEAQVRDNLMKMNAVAPKAAAKAAEKAVAVSADDFDDED